MGSGRRLSASPASQTSAAPIMKRTPAKQRMVAVSEESMANIRYPILINGSADPHRMLQRIAIATAAAGLEKNLSSFDFWLSKFYSPKIA